ncbi:hypothetical protein [Legionella fallonii]|uniref:Coiled-coil protein n=1 Tax=Legionella fallonii LLAP-10 TaxID=1212491 RepID=A0A098G8F3_9GAMM|nr:hypothetical protein [Legionella fallonii]CEG58769.1 membrane protein of unknown function [Legionella fallonii LLAP-10]
MGTEKLSADLDLISNEDQWNGKAIRRRKKLAQMMQEKIQIKANPPEEKAFIQRLLTKKIPFLSGFLQSLKSTGSSITSLLIKVQDSSSHALQGANAGFQYIGLGLAAINFVRIPLIYLSAFIVGEKPPFTLSTGANWAYSAVLLGLTLAALLVPVAAPPIAILMASMGLVAGVVSLGNMIYQRYKLQKSLKNINADIEEKEAVLDSIQQQARTLEEQLTSLDKEDKNYQTKAGEICKKIDALERQYESTKNELQGCHDKKLLDEKTLSGMGSAAFMDKGVGIVLSSIAVIGLVLSLFFPPVGLGLVAASAGLGTLYVVGRVAASVIGPLLAPHLKKLGEKFANTSENTEDEQLSHDLDKTLTNQSPSSPAEQMNYRSTTRQGELPILGSTLKTMRGLFGEEAGKQLHALKDDAVEMGKLDDQLLKIIESGSHLEALNFFRNLAVVAQKENCPHGDLQCLFNKFSNMSGVLPLLERALDKVKNGDLVLSEVERVELHASEPLIAILQQSERRIDLDFLVPSHISHTTRSDAVMSEKQEKEEYEQCSLK